MWKENMPSLAGSNLKPNVAESLKSYQWGKYSNILKMLVPK